MEAKYDKIGMEYNRTRKADEYLAQRMLLHLNPVKGKKYLDIGCGTGNYTSAYQKRGLQFIGIDPSVYMLERAKTQNKTIQWQLGTAENTGLQDCSVDGVTGSLTIHHWGNILAGFNELFRVLKRNGRIVLFTSTPKQMKGYWLNKYFPQMLASSMEQMPSYAEVEKALSDAGFIKTGAEKYFISPNLEDKFLYCGKHNPELYFDENIRHGISSFSSLANQKEVLKGLAQLKVDISEGTIEDIINKYNNDMGDYLFIRAEKN